LHDEGIIDMVIAGVLVLVILYAVICGGVKRVR
jgi:hypothetical protein